MGKKETDWCTAFPDWLFGEYIGCCCYSHDKVYVGGSFWDKLVGDWKLASCIGSRGWKFWIIAWLGVYPIVSTLGIFFWVKTKIERKSRQRRKK